jgi:signal-transduction protein with cAMP-binding, CBS, and nucleotidyltransferase domain
MATVKDVLEVKGTVVYDVWRSATVYQAIEKMVQCNVGALVVTDEGVPCGILTERDYLRRIALEGRTSKTTRVEEIMSPKLAAVGCDTDLDECMAIMTDRRLRHLVVLEGTRIVGVVSIGDVVKWMVRDREAEVQSLTNYIHGRA